MQGCASLRSRFGQAQRNVGKLEHREHIAPASFGIFVDPVQTPGDHQVHH